MERSRAELERDLFLRLLELNHLDDPIHTLEEALALAASITDAQQGYMEVFVDRSGSPRWSISRGMSSDDVNTARNRVSRGIIAEALAQGRVISTPSAVLDQRFAELASVRMLRIEAVVCAPLGEDPSVGALYLEGARFSEDDVRLLELFARHVRPVIERLIKRERQIEGDDATQEYRSKVAAHTIIGRSAAIARVLQHIAMTSTLDLAILLTGPSGTGKTLVARAIHDSSLRANSPFIELNCATIPEQLLESELFGAREGSHSAAFESREGKVGAAEGGTLFLDEVAELPRTAQAKLLQLLQSSIYFRLGDTSPTRANVRIITATNADLRQRVADRVFREDLFHRINVFPIAIPSLAERRNDIVPLAEHIIAEFARLQTIRPLPLTIGAQVALEIPEWTGNVRELENVVRRGLIQARAAGAEQIEPHHLFGVEEHDADPTSFHDATRRFQKSLLEKVLLNEDWNVTAAAQRLKIARSHVYGLIKGFNLGVRR